MRMIDELMRAGREPMVFAKDVSQHLRALLIAKCSPDDLSALLDLTQEDAQEYAQQAEKIHHDAADEHAGIVHARGNGFALGVVAANRTGKRRAEKLPADERGGYGGAQRPHQRTGKAADRLAGEAAKRRVCPCAAREKRRQSLHPSRSRKRPNPQRLP